MSDPCERCGKPVEGWVDERCCSGHMCGCQGRSIIPCWCTECWDAYDAQSKINAAAFAAQSETEGEPNGR